MLSPQVLQDILANSKRILEFVRKEECPHIAIDYNNYEYSYTSKIMYHQLRIAVQFEYKEGQSGEQAIQGLDALYEALASWLKRSKYASMRIEILLSPDL